MPFPPPLDLTLDGLPQCSQPRLERKIFASFGQHFPRDAFKLISYLPASKMCFPLSVAGWLFCCISGLALGSCCSSAVASPRGSSVLLVDLFCCWPLLLHQPLDGLPQCKSTSETDQLVKSNGFSAIVHERKIDLACRPPVFYFLIPLRCPSQCAVAISADICR